MRIIDIGKSIQKIRKSKGITAKQLSKLSGVTESAINYYERNMREPKLHILQRIVIALDMDIVEFFAGCEYQD